MTNSIQPFSESLSSHAKRLRSDIENCYNLLMEVRFVHVEQNQIELLLQVATKCENVSREISRIVKERQNANNS